jgi:cytochrome c biogenesis protein CcdA
MDVMGFMETMGTSSVPLVASFFIGLMMAISPCPLVTNITAIAYVSKKIGSGIQTLLTGLVFTAGRMVTYVAIASSIVFTGLTAQAIALPLQRYGDLVLGPLFLVIGILMLDVISFPTSFGGDRLSALRENLSDQGYLGSLLLGALFALSYVPSAPSSSSAC